MLPDVPSYTRTNNLPRRLTPLVGRQTELAQIRTQLLDSACRLLTLLGPGGIGKTCLALAVAATLADEFANDICFVDLQPLSHSTQVPGLLAEALSFPVSGSDPVESQLVRYLANKEMLLLLDNFEHLLAGAEFLAVLLAHAPGIKLLVTTREVLNLREEWLFPLTGLVSPPNEFDPAAIEQYSAVQLFLERMRRLRPHFVLAEEAAAVAHICQLTEGMPLALELAATWTKSLSCTEIVDEIKRGLDFLATNVRNAPERHRSMLAVFQQSWQQLTAEEQTVFARLSVFRGGFRREAAAEVAGATLAILSALVDKSLLRWEGTGRYHTHELLRQFGEGQLAQRQAEHAKVRTVHASYYLRFLQERLPAMLGGRQHEARNEISNDLDNWRTAWDWAVAQGDVTALAQAAPTLSQFFHMHSRFQEGASLFAEALRSIDQAPPSVARTQAWATLSALLGWLYLRNTRFQEAQSLLEQSVEYHRQTNHSPALGLGTDPRLVLGILTLLNGQYTQAAELANEALATSQRNQQPWNELFAWNLLGFAHVGNGNIALAQQAIQTAISLAERQGERWFVAYLFKQLGNVAMIQQETTAALHSFERSYAHHQEFGDQEGMAGTLNNWGDIELQLGRRTEAQQHFQQALRLYQIYQDKGGLHGTYSRLGYVAMLGGDSETARRYLHHALELATQHTTNIITLMTLARISELLLQVQAVEQSIAALAYVYDHPASDPRTQQLITALLDKARAATTPSHFQSVYAASQKTNFSTLSVTLLHSLSTPFTTRSTDPAAQKAGTTGDAGARANANLVEPLTERELEILRLIAEGQTNLAIADKLILSPGTVKWYSSEIYGKLGVANRMQAVAEARRLKLLTA